MDNIILLSDSYKVSHWRQYPPGTEYVYSYLESRGCDREGWDDCCFFGLQYFLKKYLVGEVVTREKIAQAEELYMYHFSDGLTTNPDLFYKEGWEYIVEHHQGKLPVKIKAVPEGMVVPLKTPLMTVVNTDPNCFWLTNFLESLLVQVWYPTAVATNSRNQKKTIQAFLEQTGCQDWQAPNGVAFKLHDFGFRGVSSVESAALGGMGHLVNFMGTDTVVAVLAANQFYNMQGAAGYSIPASEHSTITSWGADGELDAMRNMLEQYPTGIVACVSDSFDIYRACREYWGHELKDLIKGRITENSFGRLVVRPDSGDPAETVVTLLHILCEQFAEDVMLTPTGHKLLPPYIRLLQGDGVDYTTIPQILHRLSQEGFAAENVAFGSGGALLQKLDRDTLKVAFKCSEVVVDGQPREVFKDPIGDAGKVSKKGRLTLQFASDYSSWHEEDVYQPRHGPDGMLGGSGFLHFTPNQEFVTVASGRGDESRDILVEVFENGTLLREWDLAEIRQRADIPNGPFSQDLQMEGQMMEGQMVEDPMMQGQIMEGQIMEGQILEGQIMDRQILEGQMTEEEIMEARMMQEDQMMEDQMIQGASIERFEGMEGEVLVEGTVSGQVAMREVVEVMQRAQQPVVYERAAEPEELPVQAGTTMYSATVVAREAAPVMYTAPAAPVPMPTVTRMAPVAQQTIIKQYTGPGGSPLTIYSAPPGTVPGTVPAQMEASGAMLMGAQGAVYRTTAPMVGQTSPSMTAFSGYRTTATYKATSPGSSTIIPQTQVRMQVGQAPPPGYVMSCHPSFVARPPQMVGSTTFTSSPPGAPAMAAPAQAPPTYTAMPAQAAQPRPQGMPTMTTMGTPTILSHSVRTMPGPPQMMTSIGSPVQSMGVANTVAHRGAAVPSGFIHTGAVTR